MRINIYLIIVVAILLHSCSITHVDSLSQFIVQGDIIDNNTVTPLDNVRVIFIDIDMDSERSKKNLKEDIGVSDNAGNVNLQFNYWWGYEQGLLKDEPKLLFDIELYKEHYKAKLLHFRVHDLSEENNKIVIPLGKVYLETSRNR